MSKSKTTWGDTTKSKTGFSEASRSKTAYSESSRQKTAFSDITKQKTDFDEVSEPTTTSFDPTFDDSRIGFDDGDTNIDGPAVTFVWPSGRKKTAWAE